jgi:flavin reductase (DIM6/NTAB) family NADH-FMN oxidoreductase RutF
MRKNFGVKTWLYPMPVFIVAAYDNNGKPNAMNAAWGGIYTDNMIGICLSEDHKTTQNILATRAFTVSMATAEQVTACDYVGIVSGNKEPDKVEKAGWHTTKSEVVDAPLFDELPMALECKLISYDEETCRLVGEIVNVCADERILDDNGKIDLNKFSPITYDPIHHTYRKLGEVVGQAFSDGMKLK